MLLGLELANQKAKNYLNSAIKITEEVFEKNHPDTAKYCYNFASLYFKLQDFENVGKYFYKSWKIYKTFLPNDHPTLLEGLKMTSLIMDVLTNEE